MRLLLSVTNYFLDMKYQSFFLQSTTPPVCDRGFMLENITTCIGMVYILSKLYQFSCDGTYSEI